MLSESPYIANSKLDDYLENELKKYIDVCSDKIIFHTKNAINSSGFNQLLSITNTILSSGIGLAMIVLGTKDYSSETVAITGGLFSFFLTIFQRVQSSYNFPLLQALHFNASDNFLDVKNQFSNVERKLLENKFNLDEYEKAIIRLQFYIDKSHIQTVRSCPRFLGCICFK